MWWVCFLLLRSLGQNRWFCACTATICANGTSRVGALTQNLHDPVSNGLQTNPGPQTGGWGPLPYSTYSTVRCAYNGKPIEQHPTLLPTSPSTLIKMASTCQRKQDTINADVKHAQLEPDAAFDRTNVLIDPKNRLCTCRKNAWWWWQWWLYLCPIFILYSSRQYIQCSILYFLHNIPIRWVEMRESDWFHYHFYKLHPGNLLQCSIYWLTLFQMFQMRRWCFIRFLLPVLNTSAWHTLKNILVVNQIYNCSSLPPLPYLWETKFDFCIVAAMKSITRP